MTFASRRRFLVQEPGDALDVDVLPDTFEYIELRDDNADLETLGFSLSWRANVHPMVTALPPELSVAHLPVTLQCGDEVIEVNSVNVAQLDLPEVAGMLRKRPLRVLLRRRCGTSGHQLTTANSLNLPGRWEPKEKMWVREWAVRCGGRLGKDMHVEVLEDPWSSDTTGCNFIWPASLALARFMELLAVEQGWGDGGTVTPRVVELGAGCGLVALTAAALGACVIATERHASMQTLQQSLARNQSQVPVSAAVLEWGASASNTGSQLQMADLVLASDVTFSDELLEPLAVTLVELLQRGSTCCWLAHDDSSKPGCWRQRERFFGPVCKGYGLVVNEKLSASAVVGQRWASEHIWLYKLTKEVPILDLNSCD